MIGMKLAKSNVSGAYVNKKVEAGRDETKGGLERKIFHEGNKLKSAHANLQTLERYETFRYYRDWVDALGRNRHFVNRFHHVQDKSPKESVEKDKGI
jgi:hypothetical protein